MRMDPLKPGRVALCFACGVLGALAYMVASRLLGG